MSIDSRIKQHERVFGDWSIKEAIGKGERSVIFRLRRKIFEFEENCAMKVINIIERAGNILDMSDIEQGRYYEEKQDLCEKAQTEVKLMYDLQEDTYIVRYLDYRFEDWQDSESFGTDLFIRMDLLDSLGSQIRNGRHVCEKEILEIGMDICQALLVCHKKNILHMDIKPENVFVSQNGLYLLGDFGISKILENNQHIEGVAGTRAYAAPEQFNGSCDIRSDIYSLGLMLYELGNENRLPFAETTFVQVDEIEQRIRGKELESPSGVSTELAQIILKACAFRSEERYQSVESFLKELETLYHRYEEQREIKSEYTIIEERRCKQQTVSSTDCEMDAYRTLPAVENFSEKNRLKTKWKHTKHMLIKVGIGIGLILAVLSAVLFLNYNRVQSDLQKQKKCQNAFYIIKKDIALGGIDYTQATTREVAVFLRKNGFYFETQTGEWRKRVQMQTTKEKKDTIVARYFFGKTVREFNEKENAYIDIRFIDNAECRKVVWIVNSQGAQLTEQELHQIKVLPYKQQLALQYKERTVLKRFGLSTEVLEWAKGKRNWNDKKGNEWIIKNSSKLLYDIDIDNRVVIGKQTYEDKKEYLEFMFNDGLLIGMGMFIDK